MQETTNNLFFSIIIPVYNVAQYLGECLDSVLAQTFKDWEAICVDDGSTDGSGVILDEYAAKDNRFKVVHKENGGVGAARNKGLEIAKGDLIMFLDADDLLRESALSDINIVFKGSPDIDFVVFDDVKFNNGDGPGWHSVSVTAVHDLDLSKCIPDGLASVCVGGLAYKRSVVEGVRFKNYVLGEDLVFFCEIMAKARKCRFLGKAEYANRLRKGSASRSMETYRKIYDRIVYHESMFKEILESGKNFGKAFTHGRGNSWIESIPSVIFEWGGRAERADLFNKWCDSMCMASTLPFFSPWQKFVARLVSMTRSVLATRLLCILPYRLKCRGFHR